MSFLPRSVWFVLFPVISVSFSCKASQTQPSSSTVHSSDDRASDDEAALPDYTPKYLNLEAPTDSTANATPVGGAEMRPGEATELSLGEGPAKRYFYTVYSWQGTGPFNLPRFTHTWAVFAKLDGTRLESDPLKYFTISWDAADGVIGIAQPEKAGHNYTLAATYQLRTTLDVNTDVRRSRMVEISKGLFDAAYRQYGKINAGEMSGRIRYKMLDDMEGRQRVRQGQVGGYMNCQHAISDILARNDGSLENSGIARGFAAGDMIYDWFRNSYVDTGAGMEKIAQRLNLQSVGQ